MALSAAAAAASGAVGSTAEVVARLLKQLRSEHLKERLQGLESLIFKLDLELLFVSDLVADENLLAALLEWFNQEEIDAAEEVLALLHRFAQVRLFFLSCVAPNRRRRTHTTGIHQLLSPSPLKLQQHPTSAQILVDIGGVEFLRDMAQHQADQPWAPKIDSILHALLLQPQRFRPPPPTQTQAAAVSSTSALYPTMTTSIAAAAAAATSTATTATLVTTSNSSAAAAAGPTIAVGPSPYALRASTRTSPRSGSEPVLASAASSLRLNHSPRHSPRRAALSDPVSTFSPEAPRLAAAVSISSTVGTAPNFLTQRAAAPSAPRQPALMPLALQGTPPTTEVESLQPLARLARMTATSASTQSEDAFLSTGPSRPVPIPHGLRSDFVDSPSDLSEREPLLAGSPSHLGSGREELSRHRAPTNSQGPAQLPPPQPAPTAAITTQRFAAPAQSSPTATSGRWGWESSLSTEVQAPSRLRTEPPLAAPPPQMSRHQPAAGTVATPHALRSPGQLQVSNVSRPRAASASLGAGTIAVPAMAAAASSSAETMPTGSGLPRRLAETLITLPPAAAATAGAAAIVASAAPTATSHAAPTLASSRQDASAASRAAAPHPNLLGTATAAPAPTTVSQQNAVLNPASTSSTYPVSAPATRDDGRSAPTAHSRLPLTQGQHLYQDLPPVSAAAAVTTGEPSSDLLPPSPRRRRRLSSSSQLPAHYVWLIEADRAILTHTVHRLTQHENLPQVCRFISEVLTIDFPPQSFLQHPHLVEALFAQLAEAEVNRPPTEVLHALHALVTAFVGMLQRSAATDFSHCPLPMEETVLSFVHTLALHVLDLVLRVPSAGISALSLLRSSFAILESGQWTPAGRSQILGPILSQVVSMIASALPRLRGWGGAAASASPARGLMPQHRSTSELGADGLASLVPTLLDISRRLVLLLDQDQKRLQAMAQDGRMTAMPVFSSQHPSHNPGWPSAETWIQLSKIVSNAAVRWIYPDLCQAATSLLLAQDHDQRFSSLIDGLKLTDTGMAAVNQLLCGGTMPPWLAAHPLLGEVNAAMDADVGSFASLVRSALPVASFLSTTSLDLWSAEALQLLARQFGQSGNNAADLQRHALEVCLTWLCAPSERLRAAFIVSASRELIEPAELVSRPGTQK